MRWTLTVRSALNMCLPFMGLMTFIIVWELIVLIWSPPDYLLPPFLPSPSKIFNDWNSLAAALGRHRVTRSCSAFSQRPPPALLGAAALHFYPRSAKILLPVLLFVQITPQIAIAPILFLWLGLGTTSESR